MKKFIKKEVLREDAERLVSKYGLSPLEASILCRRGITQGQDLLYFLENDQRFIHSPFLLGGIEDAVERILQAKEENEKILIFGDRDVDGITSTSILFGYLKNHGYDVSWRIPNGEDSYGLSLEAVNEFSKNYGSLIITVDCGISNNVEIAKANELGIDVIITDHHNPPEILPEASIIIDPKLKDSTYPFQDISGAAVAFKLVQALRFAQTDFFNQDFCFINLVKENSKIKFECLKLRNTITVSELYLEFDEYPVSFTNTKLNGFLQGQFLCAWDEKNTKALLKELFGSGIDFNLFDVKTEIGKLFPSLTSKNLNQLKTLSKSSRYSDSPVTEVQTMANLFVTYIEKTNEKNYPDLKNSVDKDLQLVTLAALADIMPLKNENRIFIKAGLASINNSKPTKGLAELFSLMDIYGKPVSTSVLGWKVNPAINAAGRVGQSFIAVELLTNEEPSQREKLAATIIDYNEKRKLNVSDAEKFATNIAEESIQQYNNKLCVVADERINKGITGLLAGRFVSKYQVPSLVLTLSEDKTVAAGSLRSCRGCISTELLNQFGDDFFINHGGHDCAAGFSFESSKMELFKSKLKQISSQIVLSEEDEAVYIDAEIPVSYMTPDLCKIVENFEPYGEQNEELLFYSKNIPVIDMQIVGKSEPQHLKIVFDCGNYKFPAMYWGAASKFNTEFSKGDKLNILYNVVKNTYNGISTPQIIIIDAEKSY